MAEAWPVRGAHLAGGELALAVEARPCAKNLDFAGQTKSAPVASAGERGLDQRRHKPHMVLQGRGKAFGGVPHSASPIKKKY